MIGMLLISCTDHYSVSDLWKKTDVWEDIIKTDNADLSPENHRNVLGFLKYIFSNWGNDYDMNNADNQNDTIFTFNGCNKKDDVTSTTYNVIKTIEVEGLMYDFDYDSVKNCVTVSANDGLGISILAFVNNDGTITSMYELKSGKRSTLFEEIKDGYPITTYNDAGDVKSVEYGDLMVSFKYNDYVDNKLTGITYCEWDDYHGWDAGDEHFYNVEDYEAVGATVKYIETTNSSYRMFNSMMWFF